MINVYRQHRKSVHTIHPQALCQNFPMLRSVFASLVYTSANSATTPKVALEDALQMMTALQNLTSVMTSSFSTL